MPVWIIVLIVLFLISKKPADAPTSTQTTQKKLDTVTHWWDDAARLGGSLSSTVGALSASVRAMAPSAQAFVGVGGGSKVDASTVGDTTNLGTPVPPGQQLSGGPESSGYTYDVNDVTMSGDL